MTPHMAIPFSTGRPVAKLDAQRFRRKLQAALNAAGAYLTGEAKQLAPVDRGVLRNAIGYREATPGPAILWGVDARLAPYARYIEFGFRPHWVPFSVAPGLRVWARRVAPQWLGADGVYVGGPGSRLQSSPLGAAGLFPGPGGIRPRTWATRGGTSPWLRPGTVGRPFLRPALEEAIRSGRLLQVMRRGYNAG